MILTKKKVIELFKLVVFCFSLYFILYTLYLAFSGLLILPQTFSLGPLTFHYYGIIMAFAVASGFYLAKKRIEKYQIEKKIADDIIFWLIIGGFLGARLYHILSSFSYYQQNVFDIFKVWQGGLSIYGAVFGGLLSIFLLAKRYNLNATRLLNWLTPSLILGQIIGRFGNLFNYEAFGYPTNLPWKMFVPENFRPENYVNFEFFHPWFLYEQIALSCIFCLIMYFEKNKKANLLHLFWMYLLCYNIVRLGLEFLRIDSQIFLGFRQNFLVSLSIVVLILTKVFIKNTITKHRIFSK